MAGAQVRDGSRGRLRPLAALGQRHRGTGQGGRDKGIKLKPLARNLVDRVWGKARPAPPKGPVVAHALKYAGKPADQKISELQATLRKDGQDAVVLTLPDSIAWLFNIRGSDVAHNPVALAFAIVPVAGKPELFVDSAKIGAETKAHLAPLAKISAPAALEARLAALKKAGKRVRLDPATAAFWFFRKLKGGKARIVRATDPCILPKARKNAAEIKGTRAAHKRDGAAMVRFLAWLDREVPKGGIDEIGAAQQLETMRAETQALKEISFDTISGAGAQRRHRPLSRHQGHQPQARHRASCSWSTRAPSISTAPPTSLAPSPSASRRARCRSGSRWS